MGWPSLFAVLITGLLPLLLHCLPASLDDFLWTFNCLGIGFSDFAGSTTSFLG